MGRLAVLTLRNEGAFLLEWLAHHKAVGFTDFLVFSNDCEDGTDAMLGRLAAMGEITHQPNPGPHEGGVQFQAMKLADRLPVVAEADWILALDIDEFVNIHVGDHTLDALFAALPRADAITLTWRLFGNCGVQRFEDRPVTAQFTRAAPEVMVWPWRAFMFKTLYRNSGAYRKLGVHRPRSPAAGAENTRWFDGQGRELEPRFRKQGIFSPFGRPQYALAQLNHYPLGAMESYVVKRDRGRAVHDGEKLGLDYWTERNWCAVEDRSIGATAAVREAERARLMADPTLAALHAAAVAWRRARFDALMLEEPNRALFGRMLMAPPARMVGLNEAKRLFAFAHAAGVGQSGD